LGLGNHAKALNSLSRGKTGKNISKCRMILCEKYPK
jgi:hypothetical protein